MRRFLSIFGFLFFSFLGGAVGQNLAVSNVGLAAYQMLAVWTGAAGASIPSWVSSHWGFGAPVTTVQTQTPFFSVSPNGGWAGIFASRSSDNAGMAYTSALNHLCVADAASNQVPVWCQYLQGEVLNSMGTKQLIMVENSIYNTQTPVTSLDPFAVNHGGAVVNFRPDCGDGQTSPTPTNCSSAIQILNNGAAYGSPPFIVGATAVDTTIYPNPPTIALPTQDAIAWYTSAGVLGARMFAGAGSPAGVVSCTDRCLYMRTDGGAGSTLYVNETGGGTSGWSAK